MMTNTKKNTKKLETSGPWKRTEDIAARDRGYTMASIAIIERLGELARQYERTSEHETGALAIIEREVAGLHHVLAVLGESVDQERRQHLLGR